METIGERIRRLRELKAERDGHCTQYDLGKALGKNPETVRKWESGEIKINSEKIVALAEYFDVSCDYLLRGGETDHLKLINKTGLSDTTIQILEHYVEQNNPCIPYVFNTLATEAFFLLALHEYFTIDYDHINFELEDGNVITIPAQKGNIGIFSSVLFESFEPIARLNIMDLLKGIRNRVMEARQNGKS